MEKEKWVCMAQAKGEAAGYRKSVGNPAGSGLKNCVARGRGKKWEKEAGIYWGSCHFTKLWLCCSLCGHEQSCKWWVPWQAVELHHSLVFSAVHLSGFWSCGSQLHLEGGSSEGQMKLGMEGSGLIPVLDASWHSSSLVADGAVVTKLRLCF